VLCAMVALALLKAAVSRSACIQFENASARACFEHCGHHTNVIQAFSQLRGAVSLLIMSCILEA
jgi:hypothetical protein